MTVTNTIEKSETIRKFGLHERDTASSKVQIALLTNRINSLTEHFKKHKKDHHSRQGLLKLVGQRRKLLRYLHRKDLDQYKQLIAELKIRG